MVEIEPFRGIRYNAEKVGDISRVVASAYDIMSEEERQGLLKKSAFSFARLSLGNQGVEKNSKEGNYAKAAGLVSKWLVEEALVQEREPAFYVYRQGYSLAGKNVSRLGLLCLLRLEPFSQGNVLPHEKTLPKPKQDRMKLLEATKCDFEPIWLLFEEKENDPVEKILEESTAEKPAIDFFDEKGNRHELWLLEKHVERMKSLFESRKMFIADGHHRYETALRFAERNSCEGARYKMVYCLGSRSPCLLILPIHRALKKVPENDSFLQRLSGFFELKETSREEMLSAIKSGGIGMLFKCRFFLLEKKPAAEKLLGKKPAVLRGLPTVALDAIVFQKILQTGLDNIAFEKNAEKLAGKAESGEFEAAFFLPPTSIEQFEKVSLAGEVMPQKSTYFWPKPLSGLVFHKIE